VSRRPYRNVKIDAKIMPNYKGLDIENCIVECIMLKSYDSRIKTFSFIFLKTK
jgi:hypothetical protein